MIRGYGARLDPCALGLGVTALLAVRLERHGQQAAAAFHRALPAWPEVTEVLLLTDDADYLLRVVVADRDANAEFALRRLMTLPGVASLALLDRAGDCKARRLPAVAAPGVTLSRRRKPPGLHGPGSPVSGGREGPDRGRRQVARAESESGLERFRHGWKPLRAFRANASVPGGTVTTATTRGSSRSRSDRGGVDIRTLAAARLAWGDTRRFATGRGSDETFRPLRWADARQRRRPVQFGTVGSRNPAIAAPMKSATMSTACPRGAVGGSLPAAKRRASPQSRPASPAPPSCRRTGPENGPCA